MPQVGVDAPNRVWVGLVAAGQRQLGYLRAPLRSRETGVERARTADQRSRCPTSTRAWPSDGKGKLALVWQGFRGKNSNIFCRRFDGEKWSPGGARHQPRGQRLGARRRASTARATSWVAYDSYKNGNYDVFLSRSARRARLRRPEMTVAATPRFEARATVAVDTADRVWVAWEAGMPNWGKDNGYRHPRDQTAACRWAAIARAAHPLPGQWANGSSRRRRSTRRFPGEHLSCRTSSPTGTARSGSPAQAAQHPRPQRARRPIAATGNTALTHLDGDAWSKAIGAARQPGPLQHAHQRGPRQGRQALVAWPTDNRRWSSTTGRSGRQVYAGVDSRSAARGSASRCRRRGRAGRTLKPGARRRSRRSPRHPRLHGSPSTASRMHIVRGDFHRHTELSWDGGGTHRRQPAGFLPLHDRRRRHGFRRVHRSPGRRLAVLVVVHAEDDRHVSRARRVRADLRLRAQRRLSERASQHVLCQAFRFARGAVLHEGRRWRRSTCRSARIGDEPDPGTGELAANDTKMLYEEIRGAQRPRRFRTPPRTRMGTDWRDNDPALEPVVEIFQGARANSEQLGAPLRLRHQRL